MGAIGRFLSNFSRSFWFQPAVPKPNLLEPWNAPPTLNGFNGGDLVGIADHLDSSCRSRNQRIYLTPIFTSTANHRYHTYDYFTVEPILGGNHGFDTFLQRAHDRGIRVVLEGSLITASRGFYQFNHTLENGAASPYRDWSISTINGSTLANR